MSKNFNLVKFVSLKFCKMSGFFLGPVSLRNVSYCSSLFHVFLGFSKVLQSRRDHLKDILVHTITVSCFLFNPKNGKIDVLVFNQKPIATEFFEKPYKPFFSLSKKKPHLQIFPMFLRTFSQTYLFSSVLVCVEIFFFGKSVITVYYGDFIVAYNFIYSFSKKEKEQKQ